MGTLLLLVLVIVEVSDLVFAVDSIPAIFGITTNPFIVYTSNVFAILGLRSLYFLLAGVVEKFHYLKIGLAIVLIFVGVKMLTEGYIHERFGVGKETVILVSLGFVFVVLLSSVVLSLIAPSPTRAADRGRTAARLRLALRRRPGAPRRQRAGATRRERLMAVGLMD